jgi:hypothetical protein
MVTAPVGIKCPECARQPRSARVTLKPGRAARTIAAAVGAGAAIGVLLALVLTTFGGFFVLILAYLIGLAMGEIVLAASGRYRATSTAWIAAAGAVWAYSLPLLVIFAGPFYIIGIGVAGFIAYRRVQ